MLVQYAKRLIRNVSAGLALAMIPMLNINNAAGRQAARNVCSPQSLQTSIRFFVVMLLAIAAPVCGRSSNTAASLASPSPASTPNTLKPATYSSCHVDGPYIAMTFDDGPSPGNTTRLLDILKQRNIKVTFFSDRSQRRCTSRNCTKGFGGRARNWEPFLDPSSAFQTLSTNA